MSVLIVIEHDGRAPRENLRAVVTAAGQIGGCTASGGRTASGGGATALVLGGDCRAVADAVAAVAGIDAVRLAQHPALADGLAENCAPLIAAQAQGFSHVLMASGAASREWLPRAAALADMQMVTDVIAIESPDTFVRPLYAGNALATVQSGDAIKFLSIRPTAFEETTGDGAAAVEEISGGEDAGLSTFVEARLSKLARPELTTAKIVVSRRARRWRGGQFSLDRKTR